MPFWRRAAFFFLFLLLTVAGAVANTAFLGPSVYRWHGFAISLRLLPSAVGQTRLVLTPLGEVQAPTHHAPVTLIASLEAIRIEEIRKLLSNGVRPDDLARDFERTARIDMRNFVIRQIAMAAMGGLAAPLLLRSRRFRHFALSSAIGATLVAGTLSIAYRSFNPKAFDTPTYSGALRQAPWVIQFGREAFNKYAALSQKLKTVAENLNVLYGRIAATSDRLRLTDTAGTFRVLHVSDLHNNLAGLDFLRDVAEQFHVTFIVDTGDLTDFGSPPETAIVQAIGRLPYPYVFVLGNHDSKAVAEALARQANVTLLDGQLASVHGLTLLGIPNPASIRAGVGSVDTTPGEIQFGANRLRNLVDALPTPPDIVAIHDPEEARAVNGRTPLVLCGHEHRFYVDQHPAPSPGTGMAPGKGLLSTIVCNAGTTGAAGLRYFEKEKGVPFSCAVLTYHAGSQESRSVIVSPLRPSAASSALAQQVHPTVSPQLQSIDLVSLDGSLGEYSISHYPIGTKATTPSKP